MADLYWRIKRKPYQNSLAEAIRHHAQACGVVAFTYDVHPDRVAEAVAEESNARLAADFNRR